MFDKALFYLEKDITPGEYQIWTFMKWFNYIL